MVARWGAHVIRCELIADGDGCALHLSETLDDPSWGARNAAGWELCLESLDMLLQGGALAKFVRCRKKFEPEFGPQQDPPERTP